jgi:choline dehydrogenase
VAVRDGERLTEIGASRVVLSAGTYGSPAILLRSGIGPAGELAALGVKPVLDLLGVGRNVHDQPCVELRYEGSGELTGQMERHRAETGWLPHEQVIAKFPSASCRPGFDMHIYPVGGYSKNLSEWFWFLGAACLTPRSRGTVRLTGPGSEDKLLIDHGYLTDPGGYDRAMLAEGVERVRQVAGTPELSRLLGRETHPGPAVTGRKVIERFIDHAAVHYYHPAGSCKMGPASDPDAVVDADGRVHGIEGLYVADASLMPNVTSGNTNMPTAVTGEKSPSHCCSALPLNKRQLPALFISRRTSGSTRHLRQPPRSHQVRISAVSAARRFIACSRSVLGAGPQVGRRPAISPMRCSRSACRWTAAHPTAMPRPRQP